ncbi:MAG: HAD family phosphatase [Muribaculaceae bacterium]|nr:HAD family phosphatase [Muribaculaceae bacterium]
MKKIATLRAALFDMDGTLYDSMPNHARAWMRMCEEQGLEAAPEEFFLHEGATGAAIIDMLIRRTHGRPATDDEKRDLYAIKSRYFSELPAAGIMPGALELVEEMQHRGVITVLVTGSGQASLIERLQHDFPGAFPAERCVTAASVTRGKPHPEPFLKGLELAGVRADEAVAFDNAPLGTTSAVRAGIFTVGVVTGPMPREALEQTGADIVYNSMPDCTKHVFDLL